MTHAQYVAAAPLEKDITMLSDILAAQFATVEAPEGFNVKELSSLCDTIDQKIASGSSGDARITDELHTQCADFYTALRASITTLRDTITADRDAL